MHRIQIYSNYRVNYCQCNTIVLIASIRTSPDDQSFGNYCSLSIRLSVFENNVSKTLSVLEKNVSLWSVVVDAVSDSNMYGCRYLKITLHCNLSLLILFQIPILTVILFLILDYSQSSTHYGFITKLCFQLNYNFWSAANSLRTFIKNHTQEKHHSANTFKGSLIAFSVCQNY